MAQSYVVTRDASPSATSERPNRSGSGSVRPNLEVR